MRGRSSLALVLIAAWCVACVAATAADAAAAAAAATAQTGRDRVSVSEAAAAAAAAAAADAAATSAHGAAAHGAHARGVARAATPSKGPARVRVIQGGIGVPVKEYFCPLCQDAAYELLESLPTNATQADVVAALEKLCDVLPDTLKPDCSNSLLPFVQILNATDQSIVYKYPPKSLCAVVGICMLDCCNTPFTPEQIHLAYMSDPTQMRVSWVTLEATPSPIALWGLAEGQPIANASATTTTYTNGGWNGFVHTAVMTNLLPNTRYYYSVGDFSLGVDMDVAMFNLVPELNFVTPPAASAPSYPVTFVHIGDMGGMDVADRTVARINDLVMANEIDFIVHGGDIAYSDGYEALADQFFRKIEVLSAYVPYMTCPGNHEGFFQFAPYLTRLHMPWEGVSDSPFYYAMTFGNVRLILYNTEGPDGLISIDLEPGGDQSMWMEAQLVAAHNDPSIDWIIAVGHRPMYCSSGSNNCIINAPIFRQDLEQMFNQYGVDIVIQAHRHNYERTWPVKDGQPTALSYDEPAAPIYVVSGVGGCKEGLQNGFTAPPPVWSAFHASQYGYAIITVINSTALEWTYRSAATNEIIDQFVVVKAPNNGDDAAAAGTSFDSS